MLTNNLKEIYRKVTGKDFMLKIRHAFELKFEPTLAKSEFQIGLPTPALIV